MEKFYFVTGIGTGVGKTIVSAVLVEALKADYWKPVQSGSIEGTDTAFVRSLISNTVSKFHSESYLLREPLSPHAAAAKENIDIHIDKIVKPKTKNSLIIEGAGGLMVPLNMHGNLMIDLIAVLGFEVILVSKNYLGSINHTLLSLELLKQRGIHVKGIVFSGEPNLESESIIRKISCEKILFHVPQMETVNKASIQKIAATIKL
ncbi:MAG: dethiobiotin synthase [Bacteroidota bacterium]